MLTFALCIIGFFLGICATIYFFYKVVSKAFQDIGNATTQIFDRVKAEFASSNQESVMEEVQEIDLKSMADEFSFVVYFAIEKIEEYKVKLKVREAEKAEEGSEQEDNRTERELWEAYIRKYSESSINTEGTLNKDLDSSGDTIFPPNQSGTPQELHRNSAGTP